MVVVGRFESCTVLMNLGIRLIKRLDAVWRWRHAHAQQDTHNMPLYQRRILHPGYQPVRQKYSSKKSISSTIDLNLIYYSSFILFLCIARVKCHGIDGLCHTYLKAQMLLFQINAIFHINDTFVSCSCHISAISLSSSCLFHALPVSHLCHVCFSCHISAISV